MLSSAVTVIFKPIPSYTPLCYKLLETQCPFRIITLYRYRRYFVANAVGYVSANGFTILKDSRVSEHVSDSLKKHVKSYAMLRQQLENDGTILNGVFQKDYEFKSPSAAAGIVSGNSMNGNEAWKTTDGTKLKDLL